MSGLDNVIAFRSKPSRSPLGQARVDVRESFALSILQAAAAMDVSLAEVEDWERSSNPFPSVVLITEAFERYRYYVIEEHGEAVVFGHIPLGLVEPYFAPQLGQIAKKFDYGSKNWLAKELKMDSVRDDILHDIENAISGAVIPYCSALQ